MKAARKFTIFMELPPELRTRVYEFVLDFERPIAPHLCGDAAKQSIICFWKYRRSPVERLRFHDDNSIHFGPFENGTGELRQERMGHDEVWRRLAITRSSRGIREESLPVFYSINTFEYNRDTGAYFMTLANHGRFHLVRRFQFCIDFYKGEKHTQRVLRDMYDLLQKGSKASLLDGMNLCHASPLASLFLVLRKLSKKLDEDERAITLQVPVPEWFDTLPGLKWFKEVAEGAGLRVRFIPSNYLAGNEQEGIQCTWLRRMQKKGDETKEVLHTAEDVLKKAITKYPHLKSMPRNRTVFYGKDCYGEIKWHKQA